MYFGLMSRIPQKCMNQMVLESQLPHKFVNLMFTITNYNKKLTVVCVI